RGGDADPGRRRGGAGGREGGRRQGGVLWRQLVQGPGLLRHRRAFVRGKERLQGKGLGRAECGRLREEGWQGRHTDAEEDVVFPYLGHGIGLRTQHFARVLDGTARADWFEAISENFMIRGGRPLAVLERARASGPVAVPGVSLSIRASD